VASTSVGRHRIVGPLVVAQVQLVQMDGSNSKTGSSMHSYQCDSDACRGYKDAGDHLLQDHQLRPPGFVYSMGDAFVHSMDCHIDNQEEVAPSLLDVMDQFIQMIFSPFYLQS
jgi:hypothetical protein